MTTAIADPAADVIGHRYACRNDQLAHALTRRWIEGNGQRGRPAVCGRRASKWRALHLFDEPDRYRPCPDCDQALGIHTPPPKPLDTAPKPRPYRPPLAPEQTVRARLVDPAHAHRCIPAEHSILRSHAPYAPLAPEALGYVPGSYLERVEMYRQWSGNADTWPIPLTPCKQ